MEALSTTKTMKAEIKALKEGVEAGGSMSPDLDRESRFEPPRSPKIHNSYNSDNKQFRYPEMKNLGLILHEWKEKDAQEQGQDASTTQLGMAGLCGDIIKQMEKSRDFSTEYVDISINGRLSRAMVNIGAESNIMTKTTTESLGLNYVPSNTRIKIVNALIDSRVRGLPRSDHHWHDLSVYPRS
ncbi:hypothetical protein EJD97_023395 [Solanum chilense]|uniref:Uncharacterized protein n=1 Tax=Solanum chilense TaxID=4083 RepID=A0A6N2ASC0_SOLCI|nr:hypothetical protein EJD97_023395 [Solanum chilense]